ncbi:MAG TPA: class I SAM-dependent RNA methyltransferase [Ohtaekwangia sp.]|nr:class I SAM-dependent RNA methyltransferase [Ohtaekwangia sp.]
MDLFNSESSIIITCNKWLAPYLEQEIRSLGFAPEYIFATGIELRGTMNDCIKLNLNLRCASQVHYSLKTFPCNHPDELYRTLSEFEWENLLTNDGYFSVTSHVDHPTMNTPLFANVKVKDAIVDRLRSVTGQRPNTGPDLTGAVIYLYWKGKEAEVFIDTSGETLAKHGYRKIPGKAPMLEALASATVMATKWDRESPFINPMCGSGTLAIEAALIATNRVPGLLRENYAFMHIKGYDAAVFSNELRQIREQVREVPGLKIMATDIRQDAVDVSKINAGIAGVEQYIHFETCDFEKTPIPPDQSGVVFFNPEYGERLGDVQALEETYARIGDFMKKQCKGYTGYIFTGNLELAKKIGLKAKRRIEFYNAKLDCRLLEYELYAGTRRKEVVTDTAE